MIELGDGHSPKAAILITMSKDELLQEITTFYLESGDFNGLPSWHLRLPEDQLRQLVWELVTEDLISINFGDIHPNPHIKAFDPEPAEVQLEKLATRGLGGACLYPSKRHLSKVVDGSQYTDIPFTQKLYLGEPQLKYYCFDLNVLEMYRNDPRYDYDCSDVSGQIHVKSEHYDTDTMRKPDKIYLKTFGFAYDSDFNRAVAVYLRYLANLSPEHQQIWAAKLLDGEHFLHPDYYRTSMGYWPEGTSIFSAFTAEMHHINEICKLMGRSPLFRTEFLGDERPKDFGFLVRPTLREFNNFVLLLDKMISDNIDLEFFQDDIPLEDREEIRAHGQIVREIIKSKGSLRVLEDWLNEMFHLENPKPMEEMFITFRKIRKLRQSPAHAIKEDVFDQKYFKDQRQLMIEAYDAMHTLRLIFQIHPNAKDYNVPKWLSEGKIWKY